MSQCNLKGIVNSIETMGLVDGPGIRVVIFLQGCKLRCLYCHNPETWCLEGKTLMSVDEVVDKVLKYIQKEHPEIVAGYMKTTTSRVLRLN